MFEKVLFLEKMGCDFWSDEPARAGSDINNYRVRTHGEVIPGKDGRRYFLEFHLWRDRTQVRYHHKITGKPLKHPAYDIINPCGMAIDTEYNDEKGCWRNCTLEAELHAKNYSYTQADILAVVNEISAQTFDRIIFAPHRAIFEAPHIRKIAGYREKAILDDLAEVTTKQASKDYLVYQFRSNSGDTFDYEAKSHRITG